MEFNGCRLDLHAARLAFILLSEHVTARHNQQFVVVAYLNAVERNRRIKSLRVRFILANEIRLGHRYWKTTGDTAPFE